MSTMPIFSSPPRRPQQSSLAMRELSRSGGGGRNREMHRTRRPEFRNLSNSSRASRDAEQPWRKRFREQCMDRLNEARDQSFMQRRQQLLPHDDDETMSEGDDLSEQAMCKIIQQEWLIFKADMERQSLEYGDLDDSIIEDIEDDLDSQAREYAEWEEYEQRLLEAEVMEAELADVDMDDLEELDIDDEGLL
ncbi:hypothetical protein IWW39_004985 [Coemansia spiralis]|uniref:Uncharacterized protein n=1 Tax=Coemansia spiralis TaxID=417178 RepID=A0A9W8L155_9FUNG|nr:hypothetical protein IWW39_004985 [Coemansia spiralis]